MMWRHSAWGIVLAYYSAVKVQAARIIDTPVNIISASIDAEGSDNFRIPSFLGVEKRGSIVHTVSKYRVWLRSLN